MFVIWVLYILGGAYLIMVIRALLNGRSILQALVWPGSFIAQRQLVSTPQ